MEVEPLEEPISDEDIDLDGSSVEDGWPGPSPRGSPLSSISLNFHSEEPRSLDPDNLVPVVTLGSSFLLASNTAK